MKVRLRSCCSERFTQALQLLPSAVRENASEPCSYLSDTEIAAWDADEEDMLLRVVEDRIYELEDEGDILWQHMARYVEEHPDQFFTSD